MPYTDGWTHRIKLTIPANKIDADVLNPVVPVKLSATALASVHSVLGSATTNRKKCAFASMSGTYYYAEIKDWLTGCFFVATDTLNSAVGNEFYFYMSATAADSVYMGDAGDAAALAVWANGYDCVLTFEDTIATSIQSIQDSTTNNNDFLGVNLTNASNITSDFGGAFQLNSGGGTAYLVSDEDWIQYGQGAYTIEAFFKTADATNSINFVYKYNGTAIALILDKGRSYHSLLDSYPDGSFEGDTTLNDGNYHYLAGKRDTAGIFHFVTDGVLKSNTAKIGAPTNFTGAGNIYIARNNWGDYGDMVLSFLAFSNVSRSDSYLKTMSQGMTGDLLTFATMEGADTIRELIIVSIKSNLSNITTTNGYNTNAGNLVVRSTEIGGLTSLPGIAIAPGNDTQSDLKSYGYDTLDMPVEVIIADTYTHETTEAANKNAVSQKCEQLLGDLRKAMAQTITNVKMVSYTEGGVNSYPLERNNEMAAVVAVTYTIKYETIKDDPYNQ